MNQNPEQIARDEIDAALMRSGGVLKYAHSPFFSRVAAFSSEKYQTTQPVQVNQHI